MPNPLNSVLAGDDYTDAATISGIYLSKGGSFIIEQNTCFVELEFGPQGSSQWTDEQVALPGAGSIDAGCTGVKFRNKVAGAVAIVSARIVPRTQPLLMFSAQGVPSGAPITGRVSAAGVLVAGTGFTVSRTAQGRYTVTFDTAFTAIPLVLITLDVTFAASTRMVAKNTPATTGFNVNVVAADGSFQDAAFDFRAETVV